ncbi:MAG: hypothetical protein ACRECH_08740 [Nitrososphaerales archaeon]
MWKKRGFAIPTFIEFLQSLPSLTKIETLFSDFVSAKIFGQQNWNLWDDLVIASQMKRINVNEIYSNDSVPNTKRLFE